MISTTSGAERPPVRYGILGPSPVVHAGGRVGAPGAHKAEVLLAVLLIRFGQVVTTDQLTTEIWGRMPPRKATAALHVYVSQLRKLLTGLGADNPVVTRPSGYLFALGAAELDLLEFLTLVNEARALARNDEHVGVIDRVDRAFALSPGPALGDLRDGPVISNFAAWIDEIRWEFTGLAATANLALHRHDEVIALLQPVVAEHPMYEAFSEQLMRALHQVGRRACALRVYEATRAALGAELGLEPRQSMRDLRDVILDCTPTARS